MNMFDETQNLVIQQAKHEINQLVTQYKLFNNLEISLDVSKIKENSCKKFIRITKSKPTDPQIKAILGDINTTIDAEYNTIYNDLSSSLITKSTSKELNMIIKIILDQDENEEEDDDSDYGIFRTQMTACESLNEEEEETNDDPDKVRRIQEKINAFLDSHPNKVLFDKEKLRNISSSNRKMSEILLSLRAIQGNQKSSHFDEVLPFSYVLYSTESKSYSHVKSISNILQGNSFFITLYGQQQCTRKILELMTNDKNIKKHEIEDIITIYGPLDIFSFAKHTPELIPELKIFNINPPNLYFFEISAGEKDPNFIKWCNYISFISHITIFCSEKLISKPELKQFHDLSFTETSTNTLIDCSPQKVFSMNLNINSLNANDLRSIIFKQLVQKINQFIPYETAGKYSQLAEIQNINFTDPNIRTNFEKDKIYDYSTQLLNKARNHFDKLKSKTMADLYKISKQKKYVDDFHYNEDKIVNEILRYLFINMNNKFWKNNVIIDISKVLAADVKKELIQLTEDIKNIELIGKLLQNLTGDKKSFTKEEKQIFDKIKLTFQKLKEPKSPQEINKLKNELDIIYVDLNKRCFGNLDVDIITDKISDEIFTFLNKNPIASNEEYGKFYSDLYKKYTKPGNEKLKKYFDFLLHIRKVIPKYRIRSFNMVIDKESFTLAQVQISGESQNVDLISGLTCKELYQLVIETYSLTNIPFYITRPYKAINGFEFQAEIFNDDVPISKLDCSLFEVHYLFHVRPKSTGTFLQSMIVAKEINIADDFYIRSSSKNAKFKVTFPKKHDGWFNVPFNIETPNPEESFGQDGGVLIYLKLSSKETNYLKEGNTLVHQSYQNNKWVTEDDPVFLKFPKCNTAIFLLRHCSEHRFIPIDTFLDKLIPQEKKNPKYSRNWEGLDAKRQWKRGGKPYYLPVGYQAEGVLVNNFNEDTCVGFHGVKARNVPLILNDAFKLPSELGGVGVGRIPLEIELFGIKNWGNAIFVSPSIKYAALYTYIGEEPILVYTKKHIAVESGNVIHDMVRILILQVRVDPSCTKYYPNTTLYTPTTDNYNDLQMEWRIPSPDKVFPYRVLARDIPIETFLNEYKKL